ncbi:hypothetical protein PCC6912_43250 [Chlorogloeopsis fritschii PCC 6912]|uniref:Uncharacterized protein n=1 Tax=Chlorogloeopsis fritschii PCC 6912 TaxID=211165 RepID=A0A433N571_CHLFR|nr:hypothetical protein PCC6912_43250 [Chlorogloeopsis fritschii PCC 6912]
MFGNIYVLIDFSTYKATISYVCYIDFYQKLRLIYICTTKLMIYMWSLFSLRDSKLYLSKQTNFTLNMP